MTKFYKPLVIAVKAIPVIVYPCEGVEPFLRRDDPQSVARHLEELYERNSLRNAEGFDIGVLWKPPKEDVLMTDRWGMTDLRSWGSGAFSDAKRINFFH